MKDFLPTIILRHRKENLKKCSLSGLEDREDFLFYTYPKDTLPLLSNYIFLHMDGPCLSSKDSEKGLILLDSTWKYAERMEKTLPSRITKRSIPNEFTTAYPRKQEDCTDPKRGLASIEALYIAYLALGRSPEGLLEKYYWKEKFLEINQQQLEGLPSKERK